MNIPIPILEKVIKISENFETKKLTQKFKEVSDRYMGEKNGNRLLTEQDEAVAYSISRMPATFCAVSNAVSQMLNSVSEPIEIKSLIDIGAGTGAATLAIAEQIEFNQITCFERENAMIELRKIIAC